MQEFISTIWKVVVSNKEVMAGILGIQVLLFLIILVMLALDEDEPMLRQ